MGEPREKQPAPNDRRPPLRLLVGAAFVLTAALFVPLAWHIVHSFRTCQTITESYVAGEERRDAIYHANAQLIIGARSAVLGQRPDGDPARSAEAATVRRLIGEALALQSECREPCWLTRADSLQAELRDVEAAAVVLASLGRRDEALALLTSPAYESVHDAFHDALDRYAARFKARVHRSIDYERREELGIVGVSAGILLASVGVWMVLLRVLERWRLGMLREARERAMVENRLAGALRRFRRLFHHALDAIYLVAANDGRILDANRAACAQTGYSLRELRTLRFADLDADAGAAAAWQHAGKQGGVAERRQRRRDGTEFPVEVAVRLIDEQSGPVRLCVVRDTTERKAFEAQLGRAQKMECVGRLAAGIAHDFGNVLLAVSGFAMVGRRQLPGGHPAADALSHIEMAAAQATGLARSLLHFANRPATQARPVELRGLVRTTLELLQPSLPGAVALDDSRVDGVDLWTEADPHRLQQAVLNLCLNARDAMPDGGRIAVAVGRAGGAAGAVARISVADTGSGITAEVRRRLGEPFFTTKGDGEGCGLGLFNVHTILQECGGRLEIDSVPGAGSTFSLVLPLREAPAAAPSRRPGAAPAAATARVALVFAGDLVRGLAADALRALGYQVFPATGPSGLGFRLREAACDVAVVDGDLPDDGAAACLRALREAGAATAVVLVHGGQPIEGGDDRALTTLVKPYTMPELCDAVRAAAAGERCLEGRA